MPSTIRLHRVVATKPEKLYRAFPTGCDCELASAERVHLHRPMVRAGRRGGGLANPLSEPEPATPASGVSIYARNLAGRRLPAWKGPDGRLGVVFPHLARTRSGLLLPAGGTVLQALGINPRDRGRHRDGPKPGRRQPARLDQADRIRVGRDRRLVGRDARPASSILAWQRGRARRIPPHRPPRAVEPGDRRGTALLRRPRRDDRSAGQCRSVRDRGHGGSRQRLADTTLLVMHNDLTGVATKVALGAISRPTPSGPTFTSCSFSARRTPRASITASSA